ncbi:MAG: SpoIIIAH-like family protein [Oscillospiraceae bacterium]|nr:SpoIIIAH-like family protein [Oscillospiraceae bacterium]
MKKFWKRNAVLASVLVLVCAAIALNDRYAQEVVPTEKVLGQSTLVGAAQEEEATEVLGEGDSDYFASARLTRKQAREGAISLLEEAAESEKVDAEAAGEAMRSIQTLASYTLSEAQIESLITAKGYRDCVVFMDGDSVSVVVAALSDGLQTEDVAKITDVVKQETGMSAGQIKILEVN